MFLFALNTPEKSVFQTVSALQKKNPEKTKVRQDSYERIPPMKIVFDKDVLVNALTPAMGAVSEKNTISAIEGILFTTDGPTGCILSSYDLEKGYRTSVKAEVLEEGSFIINANKLYRMIRTMPERQITIEVNEKFQTKISSGNSRFSLSALPGNDFPNLPDLDGEGGICFSQALLKKMIGQVQHAIAFGTQRPVLTGAFFQITGEGLLMVTCDGNRLALREKNFSLDLEGTEEKFSFIVPGKTLSELSKILSADENKEVVLSFGRKHVIFRMEESIFFSRLIDGEYIDYKRVIPKNNNIKVLLDRQELLECLERVALVTDDKSVGQIMGFVKCVFEGDTLKVSSASSVSSVSDQMEIEKEGEDITIGFNCRFLMEALRAISDEKVYLSLGTPFMSMVIEADPKKDEEDEEEKDGKYLYMVCPVKMKD